MKYEMVNLEERLVEGIGVKTTNQNGQAVQDIGTLWKRFFGEGIYGKIEGKINDRTIGLYTAYEGDYTKPYTFMTGVEVSHFSKELAGRMTTVIPKGTYAKFVITGENAQEAVGSLWGEIWKMHLPRNYICDFEEYAGMDEDGKVNEIYIYIGLKSER